MFLSVLARRTAGRPPHSRVRPDGAETAEDAVAQSPGDQTPPLGPPTGHERVENGVLGRPVGVADPPPHGESVPFHQGDRVADDVVIPDRRVDVDRLGPPGQPDHLVAERVVEPGGGHGDQFIQERIVRVRQHFSLQMQLQR